MKRIRLVSAFALWMVLHPSAGEAVARVYVTVSVGGAMIVGAGVIFWSFSYSTRVSGLKAPPSGTPSNALFSTQKAGDSFAAAAAGAIPEAGLEKMNTARKGTELQIPFFVYRW